MLKLFGAILGASIIIQILNYLFVKFGDNGPNYLIENLKVIIVSMPLQIAASMLFMYFYSQGVKSSVPYFYLALMAAGFSMISSWILNAFFLDGRMPTLVEIVACAFVVVGIFLFVYAKGQTS